MTISVAMTTREQIRRMLRDAFLAAQAAQELPEGTPAEFTVEVPGDTAKGDFATNAAMVNARTFRMAPQKLAGILTARLNAAGTDIQRWEVAGPGFINFFMKPRWYVAQVEEILQKGAEYGRSGYGQGRKVMVEFVSANPTGPMHMGNARGGAIGDVLAEALRWSGCDVTREFYVNDAGNQIEKFGKSLSARYQQLFLGEEAVEFPEDGYHGEDIRDHAKAYAEAHGDSLMALDEEARKRALVDYALPKNIAALKNDLHTYRIDFDEWFLESRLHPDAIQDVIQRLEEKGAIYRQDGAVWYRATAFGGEKDEVLVRQNGIPTYFAADIAYHYNKFAVRGYETVINVWGADHHGHVARLKGAMDAIGLDGSKLDIVLMQLVRLMKDGEPYRMSKRSGRSITLADLIEEIPIDAARYFFNMREPASSFDFDLDLAVKEQSDNPVYYVQYAHARICSILKNLAAEGIAPREVEDYELELLAAPEERELIRRMGQLPQEIIDTARDYDPARMTRYVYDIATLFHKFYNTCRVKGEEDSLQQARLALCVAARTVIANVLGLLKISAPEVM
ncbi:MAG: arginine--tRNA ligase [Angelakisella sp.]|jgi:arginyl-tRNA synthetase|nr:arginine--tRNA ligase [Angelakisella sp.]